MLRYYEQVGLIQSQRKDGYAYRVFDEYAISRLQQVIVLRKLRIPVKQIISIINNYDAVETVEIFDKKVEGFYLYGSLVWGDFDILSSDIDTLCVLTTEITIDEIESLRILHGKIVVKYPMWKERIEVQYNSLDGLRYFRKFTSKMGNISPGEPLHIIDAGIEWLDAWYLVQEYGVTLYGTNKAEVIPHIDKSEFIQTICNYARGFREQVRGSENCQASQAYAVLTMCRALYTLKTGEQVSKLAAAKWVSNFLPEYSELIENAIVWRRERQSLSENSTETYLLTRNFVNDIIDLFFVQ